MTHFEAEQKARELRAQALRDGINALRTFVTARLSTTMAGRAA